MKKYSTTKLAKLARVSTGDISRYLKKAGIAPLNEINYNGRHYREWGQDAWNWTVQFKKEKDERYGLIEAKKETPAIPDITMVVTNDIQEIKDKLDRIAKELHELSELWKSK